MSLLRDWLLDPLAMLFLLSMLLALPWLCKRGHRGRFGVLAVWLAACLFCSAPRAVNPMLGLLENQYAATPACLAEMPIVVLGGGLSAGAQTVDDFEYMSGATIARVAAALDLARQFANASVFVSGGGHAAIAEADMMAAFLVRQGIAQARIVRERESANTAENARNVVQLMQQHGAGDKLLLVTSALHMPRAVASFSKAGSQPCAVPVDRIALADLPFYAWMPQTTSLVKFDKLLHELLAMLAYRASGRI